MAPAEMCNFPPADYRWPPVWYTPAPAPMCDHCLCEVAYCENHVQCCKCLGRFHKDPARRLGEWNDEVDKSTLDNP